MSALHRIIRWTQSYRQANAQGKPAKQHSVTEPSQFVVEPLEQRLLLSADVNPLLLAGDLSSAAGPAALVLTLGETTPSTAPMRAHADTSAAPLGIAALLDAEAPVRVNDAGNNPAAVTPLELAPVNQVAHWVGGSGNWSDAAHWDIGVAPNNNPATVYQVIIDAAGSPTITINQDITIDTLTNGATILVANGNLTVLQQTSNSGSIQVTGAARQLSFSGTINNTGQILAPTGKLNVNHATLNVTGAGAQVLASGTTTTLTEVNLNAASGGKILLPAAASYTSAATANTIQASGAGSKIDLSGLSTFIGGTDSALLINPLNGGEIDLAGAISGSTILTLSDANSILDVAGVTSLQDSAVNVSNGRILNFAMLTQLTRVNLMATTGGKILFPAATTYASNDAVDYTIQAADAGSKIDLSHLTGVSGSGLGRTLSITASSGGEVDLAGAVTGTTLLTLAGANSIFNVAGVTSLQDSSVNVSGGTLNFSSLTQLSQVNLNASAGGQILFPAATTFANVATADFTIQATGAGSRIDLSHMTSIAGSNGGRSLSITASSGGEIDLAGAITGSTVITLAGANSILDAAGVTSLQDSAVNVSNGRILNFAILTQLTRVNLMASTGGKILFPAATTYASNEAVDYTIQAADAGSKIDLSHLTGVSGSALGRTLSITAGSGGEIDLAGAITGSTVITLAGANSILDAAGVTSLQDSAVNVSNGRILNFAILTQLTRVNLMASTGGKILFPAATTYASNDPVDYTIQAADAGSKIDLSHLTNVSGSAFGRTLSITASSGGEVDLAGAVTGTTILTLTGANSIFNVAGVTSLQDSSVNVSGGTLNFSSLTQLSFVNLDASAGGQILFPAAATFANGARADFTIQATGAGSRIDLSHMTSIAGSDGGRSLFITASSGGEIDLAGAITGSTVITLAGANSIVNLAAVTGLSGVTLTAANGATWLLPAGWNPLFGNGVVLTTSGAGSNFVNFANFNLAGVTLTVNASAFTNKGVLNAQDNGLFDFNGLLRVDDPGFLAGTIGGTFNIAGNLLGDTHSADLYAPQAVVRFDDSGTVASPQLLEAMSQDVGAVAGGFSHNFVYGTLALANNTRVKLVDLSDNAPGAAAEAVYASNLIVPAGSTLDLNGLHLYTHAGQIAGTIVGGTVTTVGETLVVSSLTPSPSGFVLQFNRPVDTSVLNLYDTETGGLGAADVSLAGTNLELISGSLVLSSAGDQITFIKTGGALPADTYTVALRSATNGFKSATLGLLDGNSDGTAGDNYQNSFTVAASSAVVVSLPDFARGPGQPVNVPADSEGIPITVSNGAGITSVALTVTYDPALFTLDAVRPGAALPFPSVVQIEFVALGEARITVTAPSALGAGPGEICRLIAHTLAAATYRAANVLQFTDISINNGNIAAIADTALHVEAYFGDATGNGNYSALDGQRVLRVAAGLDSGFALYPLIDPVIIADITRNGSIASLDATRILQEVAGLDRPEIPPLPALGEPAAPASIAATDSDIPSAAPVSSEVPLLTNDATVKSADGAAVTNSLWNTSDIGLSQARAGVLDVQLSNSLSKDTGKDWLFYTF